jgi:class 3 adenylate cyclase
MAVPGVSLPPELFATLFPFHLAFDRNMEVVQVGRVLERICLGLSAGSRLGRHFQVKHPNISLEFGAIREHARSAFILESRHSALQLKGQMVYVEQPEVMLFLCFPWIIDLTTLADLGLSLDDFAIHDPTADLLFLLQTQHTSLADAKKLTNRLTDQRAQLERLGRLKRFFSPQLAELIVAGGAEDPLKSHRREVTVVFLDLRGFTAFAETSEPEEVMGVLREYHAEMGKLILAHDGTLERFTGDGMMIFFNDPVPVPNPAERAIRMALEMRDRVGEVSVKWRKHGYALDFGVGIAQGYATIGAIGFEGRWDYGAIGTVTNLAARLCGEAKGGQVLVTSRVAAALEDLVTCEELGALTLKGFLRPVPTFSVTGLKAGV